MFLFYIIHMHTCAYVHVCMSNCQFVYSFIYMYSYMCTCTYTCSKAAGAVETRRGGGRRCRLENARRGPKRDGDWPHLWGFPPKVPWRRPPALPIPSPSDSLADNFSQEDSKCRGGPKRMSGQHCCLPCRKVRSEHVSLELFA